MREENCIFCKIANGEIPANTLFENEMFKVILDLAPASKGHALIIPKEHSKNLYDLSEDVASKALLIAQKIGKVMVKEFGCDGLNVLQNNGEAAGQTVFHFHIHLIPRYKEERKILTWFQGTPGENELEELSSKIRSAIQ